MYSNSRPTLGYASVIVRDRSNDRAYLTMARAGDRYAVYSEPGSAEPLGTISAEDAYAVYVAWTEGPHRNGVRVQVV